MKNGEIGPSKGRGQGESKTTLVVAGASGFIGRRLPEVLSQDYELVGLSRDPAWAARQSWGSGYKWRRCDLFSRRETIDALRGADRAVYLVHSMYPSARLRQGFVRDMDVICADNFARAAAEHDLELVVHLTGLAVDGQRRTHHLASRQEVDESLRARGTAVTTIRAGLVIGPGGSASQMLQNLVRRLPLMVLPGWAAARCAPIARRDVLELIAYAVHHEELAGKSYDIAGPQNHSFRQLLELTAELMDRRRVFVSLPAESPRLSTLWVSIFSGQPRAVVRPLVESFRHGLEPSDIRLQTMAGLEPTAIRTAVAESLRGGTSSTELVERTDHSVSMARRRKEVRSIQRLELPPGRNASWVAREYARWVPRFMAPFVDVKSSDERLMFSLRSLPWPLLVLELDDDASGPDRQLYWICGGLLAGKGDRARLEFRQLFDPGIALAAIHKFRPRLPWFIYRHTQALVHRVVMHFFGRHLKKMVDDSPPNDEATRALGSDRPEKS